MGLTPTLRISDAGPTPKAGWDRGRWLPSVQRAKITLSAAGRNNATVASVSFHVDMDLFNRLQEGDTLHLARTGMGGLAISVIRGETLVTAAGAVNAVPLGKDLAASYPRDVMQTVEALFRERDPTFELPEVPIEIRTGDQRLIRCRGSIKLGPYRVFMVHGFYAGTPGSDACVAISREGVSSETATNSSAQLLDGGEIEFVNW